MARPNSSGWIAPATEKVVASFTNRPSAVYTYTLTRFPTAK